MYKPFEDFMERLIALILKWKWGTMPAKWWQFWMPGSGAIGGIIFGIILWSPLFVYALFYIDK